MKELRISLDGLSVMIGIPAGRDFHPLTAKSLMATMDLCRRTGIPCEPGWIAGNAVIQWARDDVADLFLKSAASRLFWIDSDMVWEPEQFMRMLALSQHHDIVCATYPAKVDQPTFYVNRDAAQPMVANEYGLLPVWGVGLGFTVVSRHAMQTLADAAPEIEDEASGRTLREIFRVGAVHADGKRKRQGEDMAFFADLRARGFTVWLDPSVDLGHIGTKQYTGSIRDALVLNA